MRTAITSVIGGARELGMSAVSISNKLNIAPSTASESAMRGQKIVEEQGCKLLEKAKSVNPRMSTNPQKGIIIGLYSFLCMEVI